jgi:hypothetical protein
MSSSTSNSSSSPRKIYFKILLVILIGSGVAMAKVRFFTYLNDASSETILGRVLQAQRALPKIVNEEKDLMMFYGSSMTQAGFSPRQFDKAMAEKGLSIKSFNFGFGGLNPYFQDILSRRIKEQFQQSERQLKLVVLEFNPFQTTITRHKRARSLEDSFLTMLASDQELMDLTLSDPTRGVRLYNIKYLRDGISAEMVTNFFGGALRAPRQRTQLEKDEEIEKRYDEVNDLLNKAFQEEYPDYVPSRWSYEWQGAGTIPDERSAETLKIFEEYYQLQNKDVRDLDDDRLSRIATADIIELNFSEVLIEAYIRLIKNFQEFSDHVEVVLLPRNTDWITNSPEGLERLNKTIARIEKETGVVIKNHQDLDVMNPTMFGDTTHLNRYQGAVTYTKYIIEQYADLLK